MTGDDIHFEFDGEKKMTIQIMDSQYTIVLGLSFTDIDTVCDGMADETPDYKRVVASIIQSHIEGGERPDIDSIRELDVSVFRAYVSGCVSNTKYLQEHYDAFSHIDDECERFCKSVEAYYLKQTESLRETLKNYTFPTLKIPEGFYENIAVSMGDLFSSASKIASNAIMNSLDFSELMKKAMGALHESIKEQQKTLIESIRGLLASLPKPVPDFTDEEINNFENSHRKWGEFGWTYPPHIKSYEFFDVPTDKRSADALIMKYCTNKVLEEVMTKTRSFRKVKNSVYDEATENFNNKKYMSCAVLLFSMIDSHIIRGQKRKNGRNRASGSKGADIVMSELRDQQQLNCMLFRLMRFHNIHACLSKLFERGNDFRKQPVVINRNFLMHGMMTRRVQRKDCIQLLLLYYNWMKLLEG